MTLTFTLEIVVALIFSLLAVNAFYVLKSAQKTLMIFADFQKQLFQGQIDVFTKNIQFGATLVEVNRQGFREIIAAHDAVLTNLSKAHGRTMASIDASHGAAADLLRGATGAHHEAASTAADSAIELRGAAENLNGLLSNSHLFEINQHLQRMRNFFCGKD